MTKLIFSRHQRQLFQVRLTGSTTKMGRSPKNDVVLPESEVSREHAAIYLIEGQHLLKKTGQGRLWINETEQDQKILNPGDQFKIGPWEAKFIQAGQPAFDEEPTQVTQAGRSPTQAIAQESSVQPRQNLKLQIKQANHSPKLIPVGNRALNIGADPRNDIVLDDSTVSGRHLKVVPEATQIWVYDLDSTNGTYLGGVKVREARWDLNAPLKVGNCELQLYQDSQETKPPHHESGKCGELIGTTIPMKKLFGQIRQVAPTQATVLTLGESGVGKELVARAVHELSAVSKGPFVALNCGAISRELIESELFGHEKGSFTGATRQHDGAFGQARGGTLFLDEIGELPLELQPKLLRVLENHQYRRVGGSDELHSDARIIAATHRDLSAMVRNKKFREDLFFRLFVLPLSVPSLREHLEDLPLLVQTFLEEFSPGVPKSLSSEALKKLLGHGFPGNVRELRNILLRASLMSRGDEIQVEDILFPESLSGVGESEEFPFKGIEKIEEMEKVLILKALQAHSWNKAQTAKSLGIAKSTLFSKIKVYQLESQTKTEASV